MWEIKTSEPKAKIRLWYPNYGDFGFKNWEILGFPTEIRSKTYIFSLHDTEKILIIISFWDFWSKKILVYFYFSCIINVKFIGRDVWNFYIWRISLCWRCSYGGYSRIISRSLSPALQRITKQSSHTINVRHTYICPGSFPHTTLKFITAQTGYFYYKKFFLFWKFSYTWKKF